eukprot:m.22584 g.22584  ORF g.22584 m.22584 type:complete len:507 (-) comp7414_c0_seq1:109-1629(-)
MLISLIFVFMLGAQATHMSHKPKEMGSSFVKFPCNNTKPSSGFWTSLGEKLSPNASIITPQDSSFSGASQQWNRAQPTYTPLGVVKLATAKDTSILVEVARAFSYCIVPRSSGHSYGALSVLDGRIVADMSLMNQVTFESKTGIATAGPGTSLETFVNFAAKYNFYTTWGACPKVTLGGYLQGGGEGNAQRLLGVGLDAVIAIEVVTANGTLLTASDSSNQDLFWALRGGGGPGGNFGVVTMYTLQTHINPPPALHFSLTFTGNEVVEAGLRMFDPSPESFGAGFILGANNTATLGGWWIGDVDEGSAFLKNISTNLHPQVSITNGSVFDASFSDFGFWEYMMPKAYYAGGHSIQLPRVPTREEFSSIVKGWQACPQTTNAAVQGPSYAMFSLSGGKVNTKSRQTTAYPHRTSVGNFEMGAMLLDKSLVDSIDSCYHDLYYQVVNPIFAEPNGTFGVYANMIDFSLADPLQNYYMENLDRLSSIKAKADPDGYFSFPQGLSQTTTP